MRRELWRAIFANSFNRRPRLARIGQPQDIVPAAVFLASSDSAWMTGESLLITGGVR